MAPGCLDAWTAQSMATKVDEQAGSMVKQGPSKKKHGTGQEKGMKQETWQL